MWIKTIDPEGAVSTLADVYERQRRAMGEVGDFTKLGSLYPSIADVRLDLYRAVDHCPSNIPEWARQAIGLLTSVLNQTPHCASGLGEKVTRADGDNNLVDAIYADPMGAKSGDDAIDALFTYARKLVTTPGQITNDDIEALRNHGWTDLDILDANNMAAYYCYINRVANGLGLKTLTCPAPEMPKLSISLVMGDPEDHDNTTTRSMT
ncbi:MAG: hypothetical protein M5U23_04945 [Acidimicrobiia bacterium]|nr:hypothetical protein [Acidimicrobiia bacterium]